MASTTLAEASKLYNSEIVEGIAESIITVNPFFEVLPFTSYIGDTMKVNKEATLGDAGSYSIGDTITHKGSMTTDSDYYSAIKLIGDVELDQLVKATSGSAGNDQLALEVQSKAKTIARLFQAGMATGTGTAPSMNSLRSMLDANQTVFADGTGTDGGAPISFELLDLLLELVKSKDGQVDFIQMSSKKFRQYKALIRALGGNTQDMMVSMPTSQNASRSIIGYEDVPIFVNNYLDITETNAGLAGASTFESIYAGVFDDGTKKIGLTAIYPDGTSAGIDVKSIGNSQTKDEEIVRVKQYTNLALGNKRYGLARLSGLTS